MASWGASTASRYIRSSLLSLLLIGGGVLLWQGTRHARSAPAAATLPFYSDPDFTAEWISADSERYRAIHRIAPFSLRNQLGEVVSNDTLRGKIYVANFFFSSCQAICPKMVKNLRNIQSTFQDDADVMLVSHSVMPGTDSPDVLRAYAAANGISANKWHLLTGDKDAIYDLARRSYFAEKRLGINKQSGEFLHTENMLLIDRQGRIRGVYNATLPLDAERVIADIRQLKAER